MSPVFRFPLGFAHPHPHCVRKYVRTYSQRHRHPRGRRFYHHTAHYYVDVLLKLKEDGWRHEREKKKIEKVQMNATVPYSIVSARVRGSQRLRLNFKLILYWCSRLCYFSLYNIRLHTVNRNVRFCQHLYSRKRKHW